MHMKQKSTQLKLSHRIMSTQQFACAVPLYYTFIMDNGNKLNVINEYLDHIHTPECTEHKKI